MNPAEELLNTFKKWENTGKTTLFTTRGTQNGPTYKLAKDLTHATALFQEIITTLETNDDIEDWQDFIQATWLFLYAPQENWGNNTSSSPIKIPSLVKTGLLGASSIINSTNPQAFIAQDLTDEELATLVKTLQDIKEELGLIPHRYQKLTDSITSKLDSCLFILTSDDISPGRLREAREKSFELVGESLHVITLLPGENRPGFFTKLVNVSGIWVGNMTAGAVGGILTNLSPALFGITA